MANLPQVELAKIAADILPKVATAVFVIAVPLGTIYLVKKTIRQTQANNNFGQATNSEQPAFYAIQFFNALETSWYDFNVDEEECERLIKLMPSKKFFSDVNKSYQKMSKGTALTDALLTVGEEDYKRIAELIKKIPN